MRNAVILGAMVLMMATGANGQTPAVELKVGDQAPDFSLAASDGKTYKLSDFKGKKAVVVAWFPKAYTRAAPSSASRWPKTATRSGSTTSPTSWPASTALEDNKGFAEKEKADFPLLSDPTKATATAYGVLARGLRASRWTFYIGKDGKILGIDKAVQPKTSAEDMVTKLGEYGVEATK